MHSSTLYLGREWNIDHNQRAKVSNAELRYAVLGRGEPILCIHGTSIADSLITPLRFYPPLFEEYQLISYYRAGYNGSTLEKSSLSIEEGAEHAMHLQEVQCFLNEPLPDDIFESVRFTINVFIW